MSRFGEFVINGTRYDMDDLTLDEVEAIEELAGGAFSELNFGSGKVLKAVSYTLMRRDHPDLTMEDVGKVKMADMIPADEEMPKLPPDEGANEQNGSVPEGSGAQPSPVSTYG